LCIAHTRSSGYSGLAHVPPHSGTHTPCSVSLSIPQHIDPNAQSSSPERGVSCTEQISPGPTAPGEIGTHRVWFHTGPPSSLYGVHLSPAGHSCLSMCNRNGLASAVGAGRVLAVGLCGAMRSPRPLASTTNCSPPHCCRVSRRGGSMLARRVRDSANDPAVVRSGIRANEGGGCLAHRWRVSDCVDPPAARCVG